MTLDNGETLWFHKRGSSPEARCNLAECRGCKEIGSLMRFGLWMLYGIAVAPHHAIAIHSSTVCRPEGAVLFLGESGTGKSTHTRLWLEHIPDTALLNDDSPIIRMKAGVPTVYGSPWSGKTPCWRNARYEVGGIARIRRAAVNRFIPTEGIEAFVSFIPGMSVMTSDRELYSDASSTALRLLGSVTTGILECRPDAEAAAVCRRAFGII